jgi:hypothetical protein
MFSELPWRKTRLTMSVTGFPDKKNKQSAISIQLKAWAEVPSRLARFGKITKEGYKY